VRDFANKHMLFPPLPPLRMHRVLIRPWLNSLKNLPISTFLREKLTVAAQQCASNSVEHAPHEVLQTPLHLFKLSKLATAPDKAKVYILDRKPLICFNLSRGTLVRTARSTLMRLRTTNPCMWRRLRSSTSTTVSNLDAEISF